MKILDRTGLFVFSVIVLILSIVACMISLHLIEFDSVAYGVGNAFLNETVSKVILFTSIILLLLAIKCIFFRTKTIEKNEYKNGILLENTDGKLLITKETLENLVNTIVKSFEGAENATARIELTEENKLKVFVNLSVKESAVIKELSSNIQTRIKESIKNTSDLDVAEVNIKVKDIAPVKKASVQE